MSFHDQQYNEKRDFIRMQVETAASLRLPATGESLAVQCRDLSSQGVQLIVTQSIAPGTRTELSIPSPTPGLQGLEASGEVIRCSPDGPGRYVIGVQFDSLG
ncbi:hypothetical protein LCGC14_0310330 [marine sediment metagenome]